MISRIPNILMHPALLAAIISVFVITIMPVQFNRYKIKVLNSNHGLFADVVYFHDLNNDGNSEEIIFYNNNPNQRSFLVKQQGKIIDQYSISADPTSHIFNYFGDYNNNGLDEIFLLFCRNDTLFLSVINPFLSNRPSHVIVVDIIRKFNQSYDFSVGFVCMTDDNDDGFMELVFYINSGYSKQPRNLYKADIANNAVLKSPPNGTNFTPTAAYDLNGDGHMEYTVISNASGNFADDPEFPFADIQAWLMVFNKDMRFCFDPIPFGQYKTVLYALPFKPHDKTYLAVFQSHSGTESIEEKLLLFDGNGNQLRERNLGVPVVAGAPCIISKNTAKWNDLYYFRSDGLIEELDTNLRAIRTLSVKGVDLTTMGRIDIDLDGFDEFLFWDPPGQNLIITRNSLKFPVKIEMLRGTYGFHYSVINRSGQKPHLYLQSNGTGYHCMYYANPLAPMKYLIWILIFAFFYAYFNFLQMNLRKKAEQRRTKERKIAELQVKAIKNQIDPHFTLNILNSIGNLFLKNDSEKANYVFAKYAKMLRNTITASDKISVTLEEELGFVRNYLDLEKYRMQDRFAYEINIDKHVDVTRKIPKMLIHTFAENAIKHGLKHLPGDGLLLIEVTHNNRYCSIEIHDNGIGRRSAAEDDSLSTGKGLSILDQILDFYAQIEKVRISYTITDLMSESGKPAGTKALINIPIGKL